MPLSWQANGLDHLGVYSSFFVSDDFPQKHKSQTRNGLPLAPLVIGMAGSWEGEANEEDLEHLL